MKKTNRTETEWMRVRAQEHPLRLTKQEIQYPEQVFESIFGHTSLPQMRDNLKAWLETAIAESNEEHYIWIILHRRIERLVEAAWLMNRRDRPSAIEPADIAEETREEVLLQEQNKGRYTKRMYYRRHYKRDVHRWLVLLFDGASCDEDILQLDDWCACALLNDDTIYSSKQEKANLLAFSKGMKELVEAYATLLDTGWGMQSADDYIIGNDDKQVRNGRAEHIIRKFCRTFPRSYARAEMLDLLSEVLEYKKEDPKAIRNLGDIFERNLCCIDVAYYLNKKMEKRDQKLKTPHL